MLNRLTFHYLKQALTLEPIYLPPLVFMPTGRQICLHLTHLHTNAPTPASQTTPTATVIVFLHSATKELHCRAEACATLVPETARRCHILRFDSCIKKKKKKKKPSSFAGVTLRISEHPLCSQIKEQLLHFNLRCTGRKRLHQASALTESLQLHYILYIFTCRFYIIINVIGK